MSTTCCPICGSLYEGSEDHPRDPCSPCWKNGWRVDSAGNVHNIDPGRPVKPHRSGGGQVVEPFDLPLPNGKMPHD